MLKISSVDIPSKTFSEPLTGFLKSNNLTLPSKLRPLYWTARARLHPDGDDLSTEDTLQFRCGASNSRLQRTALSRRR